MGRHLMSETQIDRSKTALVVIDLQKGITSMPVFPRSSADVVANAAPLAKAFRENGMPVFLVRVMPVPPLGLRPETDGQQMQRGEMPADWAEIVGEMGPEPGDVVITKRQWGAFYGTELEMQLRRRGITAIVLCGISTNVGVESTARFAYEYGFSQLFAEDAMAARSQEEHDFTVKTTFPRIGKVRSTAELLAAISRNWSGQ